jgi:hypothetical protein
VLGWARAAARALAEDAAEDESRGASESEARLLAAAALGVLGGDAEDPAARAAAAECALRAVVALKEARENETNGAEAEDDDDEDDDDDDDDSDDDSDDSDDDDSDDDSGGGSGSGSEEEEETERQFLARYAEEARRLAGAEGSDPDAGDVDDADDGTALELDGVVTGPPGSEATALLRWLQSGATAADLGALAATLQARPIEGLAAAGVGVGDLKTALTSMAAPAIAPGGFAQHGGFGAGSPSSSAGIDFGGLRL